MGRDVSGQGVKNEAIRFGDANTAQAVFARPKVRPEELIEALGLAKPRPVLLVIGGAKSLDAAVAAKLGRLFEQGVLRAAAARGATIIDGGTESGIMQVVGKAAASSDASAPLVGVAPARRVTYPDDARTGLASPEQLDPNHSHFILANSGDWGGETSLLFEVAELISGQEPAVALVAGGGDVAFGEVRLAVDRGFQLVVVEGTKGLADSLARASRSRAKPARGDAIGAVAAEADITVVPLDSDASDLERLLARRLGVDETLREAWRQQVLVSEAANQHQRDFHRLQGLVLILGFVTTFLVVAQSVLVSAGVVKTVPALEPFFYLAILALPIAVAFVAGAAGRFRPGTRWILLRGSSETIKREIYRYRTRAGAYSHANTREKPREVKLAEAVGSAIGGLMRTDVSQAAFDPDETERRRAEAARKKKARDAAGKSAATESEPAKRSDNKLAPLSPGDYIEFRVTGQIDYYLKTAKRLERQARWLRLLALGFGALGTLLAAIGLQIYVAVTTALIGVYTTIVESWQLETSVGFYNQAAADLMSIRAWWNALPPSQQATQATVDQLVDRAERILRAENIGWVQEMQDAMTQFRFDESADGSGASPQPGGTGGANAAAEPGRRDSTDGMPEAADTAEPAHAAATAETAAVAGPAEIAGADDGGRADAPADSGVGGTSGNPADGSG